MNQYDLIIHTLFTTDVAFPSTAYWMAHEWAQQRRVFFINRPDTLKDEWQNGRSSQFFGQQPRCRLLQKNWYEVDLPSVLPINWLPAGSFWYHNCLKAQQKKALTAIRHLIEAHQINDFVYINCYYPFGVNQIPTEWGCRLNVYWSVDDISQNPYTAKHGVALEEKAIQTADLTLVTSSELFRLKSPFARNIALLPNGVSCELFNQVVQHDFPLPEELSTNKQPVVGFVGNLDEWRVDYQLLKMAAEQYPDYTFLLVGPLNNTACAALGLLEMPNLIFTGSKPQTDLPQYLYAMDCCLIPFRCNTLTRSIYPLKINEYLAAGKPVVATAFSEDIQQFEEVIFLAKSRQAFIQKIPEAIVTNHPAVIQERLAVAQSNTWQARVQQFWTLAENAIKENTV